MQSTNPHRRRRDSRNLYNLHVLFEDACIMSAIEYTEADFEQNAQKHVRSVESASDVARRIAAKHHCSVAHMLSKLRYAHLVRARLELYQVLRTPPFSWSLPAIGRFTNRDHTTVMLALASPEKRAAKAHRTKVAHATR
jgi:chromosomal replication initiation ATPase DnaA